MMPTSNPNIKPPMVLTSDDVAATLEAVDEALGEVEARG